MYARFVEWEFLSDCTISLSVILVFFPPLGLWSGNFFLIAPFPDHCLLVPFYNTAFYFHMTMVITLSGFPFQTMPILFSLKPLVHAFDKSTLDAHSRKKKQYIVTFSLLTGQESCRHMDGYSNHYFFSFPVEKHKSFIHPTLPYCM